MSEHGFALMMSAALLWGLCYALGTYLLFTDRNAVGLVVLGLGVSMLVAGMVLLLVFSMSGEAVTKAFCDRCGRECGLIVGDSGPATLTLKEQPEHRIVARWDLCKDCVVGFREWIRRERA